MTILSNITLSIVSHGQANLVASLLRDLSKVKIDGIEIIITINIDEDYSLIHDSQVPVRIIKNLHPRGFGANHNNAFSLSNRKWFVIVNPDIRIDELNFEVFLSPFENNKVGALAPIVTSSDGNVEDSMRKFPTLLKFIKRVIFKKRVPDYPIVSNPFPVDWVAGMFVVFRREAFGEINGFDENRFFMYLEDADICRRLGERGWFVFVNPSFCVIHNAQRTSRRNLRYMRWHLVSAFRFLTGL